MGRFLLLLAPLAACAGIEGDTCDHPFEVSSFPTTRRIDLADMHADVRFADTGGCVSRSNGADAVFAVELAAGQALSASLACSFTGGSVYAVFDCSRGPANDDCIDGAELGDPPTIPAVIRFWAESDDTYFVIVDYQGPPLATGGTNVCDLELEVE